VVKETENPDKAKTLREKGTESGGSNYKTAELPKEPFRLFGLFMCFGGMSKALA